MTGRIQQLETVVIRNLRRFKERYFPDRQEKDEQEAVGENSMTEKTQLGYLDSLPVDMQFVIMSFLSPADICRLGATSQYWRAMVRDPLLWRYFLLRDMPSWSSIDHVTMPRLEILEAPLITEDESLQDREDGEDKAMDLKFDYMSEWIPERLPVLQTAIPSRPTHGVVTSFLQSLVPSSEPRYAMFGPGMEQLEVSLVTKMMHSPDVLPVSGTPQRQINGIGSGISYLFNNQHKFNILTLYSTNRAERERARLQQESISNKLFTLEGIDDSGRRVYSPAPQVQQVCQVVDGFIYVANAEPGKGEGESEVGQIQAVLNCAAGSTSKPLLVLSCVAREQPQAISLQNTADGPWRRTSCIHVAKRLGLPQLATRWMVQDTVSESLSGLLDGISWLLRSSGVKLS